jgi:hypothetical protein
MSDALNHLSILYGKCTPDDGYIIVTDKKKNRTLGAYLISDLEKAAKCATSQPSTFIKYNLLDWPAMKRRWEQSKNYKPGRDIFVVGNQDEVRTVIGFALDVDVEPKPGFKSREETLQKLESMDCPPTLIVNSKGDTGGLHPYWLLSNPIRIESDAQREELKGYSARWKASLEKCIGVTLDATANLDRFLRPVGSVRTTGEPVTIHSYDPSRYYDLADLAIPESPEEKIVRNVKTLQAVLRPSSNSTEKPIREYIKAAGITVDRLMEEHKCTKLSDDEWVRAGTEKRTIRTFLRSDEGEGVNAFGGDPLFPADETKPTGSRYEISQMFARIRFGPTQSDWNEAVRWCANELTKERLKGVDISEFMENVAKAKQQKQPKALLHHSQSEILERSQDMGFISDLMRHNLATAKKPQPWFALAGAIALTGSLVGRKVTDAYGTRTNVQIISVGETGCGKDWSRELNTEILLTSGNDNIATGEDVTSDSSLYRILEEHPSKLFQADEFGRFLATTASSQSNPLFSVPTALMKLYTSARAKKYIAKVYADFKRSPAIEISQPHLVLYATSTPVAIFRSLGTSSIEDGFLGRTLIFESPDIPRTQMIPLRPIPESLIEFATYWRDYTGSEPGNLAGLFQEPTVIETTGEAEIVFQNFDDISHAFQIKKTKGSSLWARANEKARQLALIHACSANPHNPMIDEKAAEWAVMVTRNVTHHMVEIACDWLAENAIEAASQKLFRLIKQHPDGITQSQITRSCTSIRTQDRNQFLLSLVEAGLVGVGKQGATTVYFPAI